MHVKRIRSEPRLQVTAETFHYVNLQVFYRLNIALNVMGDCRVGETALTSLVDL